MKIKQLLFLILTLCLISCNSRTKHNSPKKSENENFVCGTNSPQPPKEFKYNCGTCHLKSKNTTGPKLEYILTRVPSEKWFDDYVRNEDSLAKSGDKYITEIQNYSPCHNCHNFKNLTVGELKIIKDYLSEISN